MTKCLVNCGVERRGMTWMFFFGRPAMHPPEDWQAKSFNQKNKSKAR